VKHSQKHGSIADLFEIKMSFGDKMTTVVFAAAMHTPLPRWVTNGRAGHRLAWQKYPQ
jgi:hypothetical protein